MIELLSDDNVFEEDDKSEASSHASNEQPTPVNHRKSTNSKPTSQMAHNRFATYNVSRAIIKTIGDFILSYFVALAKESHFQLENQHNVLS